VISPLVRISLRCGCCDGGIERRMAGGARVLVGDDVAIGLGCNRGLTRLCRHNKLKESNNLS
jgi:hypothetical protein